MPCFAKFVGQNLTNFAPFQKLKPLRVLVNEQLDAEVSNKFSGFAPALNFQAVRVSEFKPSASK